MLCSIVIVSKNNIIGCDNGLVFDIKEDLKRFKEITSGKTVILGRKTFESLPFVLPNRHHIILTHNENYKAPKSKEQIDVVTDINYVIEKYCNSDEDVFIIGGGNIYEKLFPYTKKLYITHVNKDVIGDTIFPNIKENEFKLINKSDIMFSEVEKCNFYYADYLRV